MRRLTQNTKAEALKRAPLFEGLSKKELIELARVTEDLQVPAGTVLCKEDTLGREFYVIVEGTVEVTRGGKPDRDTGGRGFRRRDRAAHDDAGEPRP